MEGLRGHIYVVWVPELGRIVRSRDVDFIEEMNHLPEQKKLEVAQKEENENSQIVRFRTWVMPGQPSINEENLEERSQQSNQNQQKEGNNHQLMTPRTPAIFSNNYEAREPDSPTPQTEHTNTSTGPVPTPQETETVSEETMINRGMSDVDRGMSDVELTSNANLTEIETGTNIEMDAMTTGNGNQIRTSSRSNKGTHSNPFMKEHFVSYAAIVTQQVLLLYIPQNIKEALNGQDKDIWMEACQKQLQKLRDKKTWELCDLPEGAQALPMKWVFNSKIRARLVVCRNFKEKNEEETFAAVINMVMVKIFFIIIVILNWECLQFDFETAFLNAELEGKNIYIRQPQGFGDGTH